MIPHPLPYCGRLWLRQPHKKLPSPCNSGLAEQKLVVQWTTPLTRTMLFNFPPKLEQRLYALDANRFANVAVHVGASISHEEAKDKPGRLDILQNAWIVAEFPTELPAAKPYFDWLGKTITDVCQFREPPPRPFPPSMPASEVVTPPPSRDTPLPACRVKEHEKELKSILDSLTILHNKLMTPCQGA